MILSFHVPSYYPEELVKVFLEKRMSPPWPGSPAAVTLTLKIVIQTIILTHPLVVGNKKSLKSSKALKAYEPDKKSHRKTPVTLTLKIEIAKSNLVLAFPNTY